MTTTQRYEFLLVIIRSDIVVYHVVEVDGALYAHAMPCCEGFQRLALKGQRSDVKYVILVMSGVWHDVCDIIR